MAKITSLELEEIRLRNSSEDLKDLLAALSEDGSIEVEQVENVREVDEHGEEVDPLAVKKGKRHPKTAPPGDGPPGFAGGSPPPPVPAEEE